MDRDPQQDLKIEPSDLNNAFAEHAPLAAYWGQKAAEAEDTMDKAKLAYDIEAAAVAEKIRKLGTSEGVRYTDERVKNLVAVDEDTIRAKFKWIGAKKDYSVLISASRAFYQRMHMLVSLGHHRKNEIDLKMYDEEYLERKKREEVGYEQ